MNVQDYIQRVFSLEKKKGTVPLSDETVREEFCALALEAFEFQREHCQVYREYLELIGKRDFHPASIEEIPFLPIRLFKSQIIYSDPTNMFDDIHKKKVESKKLADGKLPDEVRSKMHGDAKECMWFESSSTTGMTPSRHLIVEPAVYEQSFKEGFRLVYGESGTYNLLALLPSYLERKGSSLVYMADRLIAETRQNGAEGDFFLYDHGRLLENIRQIADGRQPDGISKTILLGVSFALLDFAGFVKQQVPDREERKTIFSDVVIIETGGMKGRGEELSREELHRRLREGFISARIDSEYGMCELLSQAYSTGGQEEEGIFFTPPWMRVLARDLQDPFKVKGVTNGGLNIIDLANVWSCCFIETEDRGRIFPVCKEAGYAAKKSVHPPFTVDGRIQNSELRGCNMLLG